MSIRVPWWKQTEQNACFPFIGDQTIHASKHSNGDTKQIHRNKARPNTSSGQLCLATGINWGYYPTITSHMTFEPRESHHFLVKHHCILSCVPVIHRSVKPFGWSWATVIFIDQIRRNWWTSLKTQCKLDSSWFFWARKVASREKRATQHLQHVETSNTVGHQRRRADKSRCATSFCRPKADNLAKTSCLWLNVTGDGVFFFAPGLGVCMMILWLKCNETTTQPQLTPFWGTTCWSHQPKRQKSTETHHLGPPTWSKPHDLGFFLGSDQRACVALNRGPNKRNFQLQRCRCEASKSLTLKDVFLSLPLHPLLKFKESCLGATARLWHRSGFHLFWQTAQWHHCTAVFWGFRSYQWEPGVWLAACTVYCMRAYLSIYLSICLSIYLLSVCLSVCVPTSRLLPIYISAHVSTVSFYLSIYLSIYIHACIHTCIQVWY